MNGRKIFTLFPLLLIATFTGWLAYKGLQAPIRNDSAANRADSFMKNVTALRMNIDTGLPQDELLTPSMIHYPKGDTTDLTTPHFIIFNTDSQPWHVTSNLGQAQNGVSVIQLWDHVKIHQDAGPQNQEINITTSMLTIYPHEQYAITQEPVTLTQPGAIAHSIGVRADLKSGDIQLFSQARGQYLPPPPQKGK
jgi:lipopolysaccharide export system protein LptC